MAYLLLTNDPEVGKRYSLEADEVTIGRHPDCEISVMDSGRVSRRHAKIIRDGTVYFLQDLGSRNGTFLNGKRVDDQLHALNDGDHLRVCDLEFVFQAELGSTDGTRTTSQAAGREDPTAEGSSMGAVLVDDEVSDDSSSTILSKLDIKRSSEGGFQMTASVKSRLDALMEITRNLGRALNLDQVLPQVLNSLFQIFLQADRGFIVLQTEDGSLVPRWTTARKAIHDETIRISRSIVKTVMESKEAILSHDVMKDNRIDMTQSIADLRIRSMMCAPLVDSEGNALGVIQVDTLDQRKRFQQEDLEVLASVAVQAGIAIDNAQLHERALRQKEIEQDLELANEVQRAFLPQARPELEGYQFFDFYRPANHVGGDYYDYVTLPDGRTAVVVADVVGHGVAAAMMMAKVSAEAKYCLASESDPATAITRLNDRISSMQIERFTTVIMVVLDPVKHEVTIVNAGHMAPIWRRKDNRIEEPGNDLSGLPVGILRGLTYGQKTIQLEPGDILTMYTDGINEAMDPAGRQYTIDRLRAQLKKADKNVAKAGSHIIADVLQHVGQGPQADDMCLVMLRRT
jgi:serine phosphatase RsbU (regulator of sigma subunit)/pSer/pThr/pTyr-binding forkhead associated (FHA) protein